MRLPTDSNQNLFSCKVVASRLWKKIFPCLLTWCIDLVVARSLHIIIYTYITQILQNNNT